MKNEIFHVIGTIIVITREIAKGIIIGITRAIDITTMIGAVDARAFDITTMTGAVDVRTIICTNNIYEEMLIVSGTLSLELQCKAKTSMVILKPSKIRNFFQTNKPIDRFHNITELTETHDTFNDANITDTLIKQNRFDGNENLEK